jgi:transcriptional regulator with XRE-family HTH domain
MTDFGSELRRLLAARGVSLREAARRAPCDSGYLSQVAAGRRQPSAALAARLDEVLDAGGELAALAAMCLPAPAAAAEDDEIAALELARRAGVSDVGDAVCQHLEMAVDDLATAYPGTPPGELLGRVRVHLGYVTRLLDGRATFAQRRSLLATGGWLSLLAATCLIDLHRGSAAAAHLRTAAQLARETGHAEIAAWCLETQAWAVLTEGGYARAASLARAAQQAAPRGGSAIIQATAQEGRACARMGDGAGTRAALARTEALVAPLAPLDQPEHHYRYDPAKAEAYVATTLSWLGDPGAEPHARHVLARLESRADGPPRPRRAASARLDLSLALIAAGRHDEAAGTALEAITSRRLVPSNYWRAREVISAVTARGVPEGRELAEAYRAEYSQAPGGLPAGGPGAGLP